MSLSTAFMPCDAAGPGPVPFPPAQAAQWGLADFDWSNGAAWWAANAPQNCEETLRAQAEATAPLNPAGKVFVYRNGVKALPWLSSVRAKLVDKAYERWFLPLAACKNYTCESGNATNANLYFSELQSYNSTHGDCGLGVRCAQYFFDVRNASLRDWLANGDYLQGPNALASPAIHGFFFDDLWQSNGTGDMPPGVVPAACGLSAADIADLEAASILSRAQMNNATNAAGGFTWNQFLELPYWEPDGAVNTIATAQKRCDPFMRAFAGTGSPTQSSALMLKFSAPNTSTFWPLPFVAQDVAQFLLVRGPYAWLGYGWSSCRLPAAYVRPPEVDVDYGEPLGVAVETAPNSSVWTRAYSKYDVQLDCNTWTATLAPRR